MGRSVSCASGAFVRAYEHVEYTEDPDDSWLWNDYINDVIARAKKAFPSLRGCERWVGREDHAVLENTFAYFGLSEYCGLVCIWMVLKDHGDYVRELRCAEHWAEQVKAKFEKTFGTLRKVGTFSNGEAVFEKKGE